MVTESAGWGPVVEQLALHGPVKDNQAVVATTPYPFHLASVVDKNHSNLSSPSKPRNLVLGRVTQERSSGKSREAGRPGNSEDRQPTQAALADNNPHERSIGDGPLLVSLGRTYKDFTSRTSPLPPSKDTSTNNPYHSTHFLFNLCCIISIL